MPISFGCRPGELVKTLEITNRDHPVALFIAGTARLSPWDFSA